MTPVLKTVASNVGIEINYTFFDFQAEDHHYESRKTCIKDPSKVFSSYISDVPTVVTGTSTGVRQWEVRSWSSYTASNACSISYYIFSLPDGWTRQYIYRLVTRRFEKYWYSLKFKLSPTFCEIFVSDRAFYRPQRSCCKVMLLHLSVILFTGGGGVCQTPLWAAIPGADPPGQTPPSRQTPL